MYSFEVLYLDIEQYFVFLDEMLESLSMSTVAIIFVVTFITVNIQVTFLVVCAVLLVDFFLLALLHYWSLTLNFMVMVNMIFAIGLAVDFSSHIAHTYLITKPSFAQAKTPSQARQYKAKLAVSQMGSSVFHGGVSTMLAIAVLGFSKSYVFVLFFRLWVGIIVFGMANGFLLLPVVLSIIGPVDSMDAKDTVEEEHHQAVELEHGIEAAQLAELKSLDAKMAKKQSESTRKRRERVQAALPPHQVLTSGQ